MNNKKEKQSKYFSYHYKSNHTTLWDICTQLLISLIKLDYLNRYLYLVALIYFLNKRLIYYNQTLCIPIANKETALRLISTWNRIYNKLNLHTTSKSQT